MKIGILRVIAGASMVSMTALIAATGTSAHAQSEIKRDFNIPSQSLASAIIEYSRQSGIVVTASATLTRGKSAAAVHGSHASSDALKTLLSGTGLSFRSEPSGIVLTEISRPNSDAGANLEDAPYDHVEANIVVVGSQIKGAKINTALPVTVVSTEEMKATGAVSGDELFRSIPQFGDVSFNSRNLPGSSNAARGDVGSLDLRNLGVGNTLVLLNGRRVVNHPTSQANGQLVPVLTYNTNAIPVSGLERLEILRDGAAAIYGADALAGVVNTVLKKDYDGAEMSLQYGGAEGTGFREFSGNGVIGKNFAENRGNITLFGNYNRGTGLDSRELYYTASSDRRPLFVGTRFEGAEALDVSNTTTPWGLFGTQSFVRVRQGALSLTNGSGVFHIQPSSIAGCQLDIGNGICIDDGAPSATGVDRALRTNNSAEGLTILPRLERLNLFITGKYDISDSATLFGEAGYYYGKTHSYQSPIATIGSIPITIPASNYWNPFGPTVFADGTVNPNRIPGINAPAAGLPLSIYGYTFSDFGPMKIVVTNNQFRLLGGVRGEWKNFNWETAVSYSEATVRDVSDNISRTKLNEYLSLSTPDAYNPFNGGSLTHPSIGDDTPNKQSTIDGMRQDLVRFNKSTLLTYDFRVSTPDFFALPAGNVGLAFGIEARRETQLDDRDPRIDGTIKFGAAGDLVNSAINFDTSGHREVFSAFGELSIPLVSRDMAIPAIRSFDVQLAGRFENYSDFGGIAVPKAAGVWEVVKGVRLRGSWSKSFRAPNLEQTNASVVTRANTRLDYIFCEADLRAGRITSFAGCARTVTATGRRAGNPDLDPERANTLSLGAVLEPPLPDGYGSLTFTADWWRVRQSGLVGIFGEGNALILDYLLRQSGQTNPNVVRAAPNATDIAAFAGTGLAPAGQLLYVDDKYVNLQPQTVKGIDLSLTYRSPDTGIGRFSLSVNASHFLKYYLEASPDIAALTAARNAGLINAGTAIPGGGNLLEQNGKPKWRGTASLTWSLDNVTIGAFGQYTGKVLDYGLVDSSGDFWVVKAQVTANLYGQYSFSHGPLSGTSVRLGVRNLTDAAPPLSSGGYMPALYSPLRRYWYANVSHKF